MYKHHVTRRPWPLTFWRIAAMTLGPIASRSPWYFRYFLHNLKFIMPAYTTWYYIKVSDEVQFYACRCDRKLTKHNFEKQHTGVLFALYFVHAWSFLTREYEKSASFFWWAAILSVFGINRSKSIVRLPVHVESENIFGAWSGRPRSKLLLSF